MRMAAEKRLLSPSSVWEPELLKIGVSVPDGAAPVPTGTVTEATVVGATGTV